MALNITIGATLILIALLGVVGFRRDVRRGVLALAGTLLGAILVGFWGPQWGQALAGRFVGGDTQQLTFIVSCLIFVFSTLVVGYGGGLLLGPKERGSFPRRLAGALLGVLDGVLIVAYLLRFATAGSPAAREAIQELPPARVLHDGLPLVFLGITIGAALLVLIRAALSLGDRERVAPPKPVPPKSAPAAEPQKPKPDAAVAPKVDDQEVLDKIKQRLS